jgi:hypothetical protein
MSRFELGGQGFPIPEIALPDPNLSSDMPVQVLELPDGVPFEKADWVALGYTHYEVWCIGGVGGRGSSVWAGAIWPHTQHQEVAPPDVWAQVVASYVTTARNSNVTSYSGEAPPGTPRPPVGVLSWNVDPGNGWIMWILTPEGLAEVQNPTHTFSVTVYTNPPSIIGEAGVLGGAGGGGGLHVVSGALADLPDSVPVLVGAAGTDALPAQDSSAAPIVTSPYGTDPHGYNNPWFYRYTDPVTFPPGQFGGDGGVSSFGDVAKASGGKGGGPAIVWVGGVAYFASHGGDGGSGGRVAAGGGGVGSSSAANGQDGTWDGTVGKGGGGGRGGEQAIAQPPILMGV